MPDYSMALFKIKYAVEYNFCSIQHGFMYIALG